MNDRQISPSDLALQALGIAPEDHVIAQPAEADTFCARCAKPLSAGDGVVPLNSSQYFSNTRDVLPTGVQCPACAVVTQKKLLNKLQRVVVTRDAVYPIPKWDAISWAFQDPPEPPFAIILSSATMQHLMWRAPVTLSRELLSVRYGDRVLSIRPAAVRKALELEQRWWEEMDHAGKGGKVKRARPRLLMADADISLPYFGSIRSEALECFSDNELSFLASLSTGEVWATVFCSREPVKPAPLSIEV